MVRPEGGVFMKHILAAACLIALGTVWTSPAPAADVKEKAAETKETIKDKAADVKDTIKEKTSDVTEKVKEKTTQAKDKAVEVKDKLKDKMTSKKSKGHAPAAMTEVREAQQALKDKGYDPGPVDGRMGPKTHSALADFQKAQGLRVTGELDPTTSSKLMATRTSSAMGLRHSAATTTTSRPRIERAGPIASQPNIVASLSPERDEAP
jgi:peptidoglycan hydrolase-like protein with peptidoglycan-binding domain